MDECGGVGTGAVGIETTGTNAGSAAAVATSSRESGWSMVTLSTSSGEAASSLACCIGKMPFSRSIKNFVIHLRNRLALTPCSCANRATDTPGCNAASISTRLLFSS